MRKILVLAVVLTVVLTIFGCKEVPREQQIGDSIVLSKEEYESLKRSTLPEYPKLLGEFNTDGDPNGYTSEVSVIAIDSCEYVGRIDGSSTTLLAHKGNCKFCRERREIQHQRLLDEILYITTHKEKDTVQ